MLSVELDLTRVVLESEVLRGIELEFDVGFLRLKPCPLVVLPHQDLRRIFEPILIHLPNNRLRLHHRKVIEAESEVEFLRYRVGGVVKRRVAVGGGVRFAGLRRGAEGQELKDDGRCLELILEFHLEVLLGTLFGFS